MYLVKPLSRDKGEGQIHNVSAFSPQGICRAKGADTLCICPFAPQGPREWLYQIHGQSLNTHRGKHRPGGAQSDEKLLILLQDRPCLEFSIVPSKFQALLFWQDKLLESV